ncbi:MAG: ion transporter [Bacteroidota bacterium]
MKRNRTKEKIHEIIFEADTLAGKVFDIGLLIAIIASILVVILESVNSINEQYNNLFNILEWAFTIIFTIEYILRLYCVYRPLKYARSFYGIIDLISIMPAYLSVFFAGSQYFIIIRGLRLMRIFRILKLGHFTNEGRMLIRAMESSRVKITIFLIFIAVLVTIIGAIMYLVEGGQNDDFTSIPKSIYWAIVTLTTVGYGDITPQTNIGQFFSALVMIIGYAVLAVPTGIVSAEIINEASKKTNTQSCRFCGSEEHDNDAIHCKYCGEKLNE